jgi:restriction system protein
MAGRGDKGLVITTGSFIVMPSVRHPGRHSANRPHRWRWVCELLKRYELGVETTVRQVEEVAIHPEFFEDV